MKNMSHDELMEIVRRHGMWLRDDEGGKRANLAGADLTIANLTGAVGGNSRMHCLQIDPYKIIILDKEIVWGGCTKKTVQEWLEYTGENLSESDKKYLETVTKPFIRMVMEL